MIEDADSPSITSIADVCRQARCQDPETIRWNWFIYAREALGRLQAAS